MQRSVRSILRIRLVFVHVTPAVLVKQDPGHLDLCLVLVSWGPVRQALYPDHVGIGWIRMSESIAAVEVPHVPELRTHVLCHPDSIARVVLTATRIDGHTFPELLAILAIAFESPGAHDHAVPSLHALDLVVLGTDRDAQHLLCLARIARN